MKKILAAVVVVSVLSVAGMAFAGCPCEDFQPVRGPRCGFQQPGFHHQEQMTRGFPGQGQPGFCPQQGPGFQQSRPMGSRPQLGEGQRPMMGPRPQPGEGQRPQFGQGPNRGPRPDRDPRRFAPDMPDEIRAKAVEAEKLKIDLEEVLSRKDIDRQRAVELHDQIADLEQEIRDWRFDRRLDRLEEQRSQPAPNPAPAPEEKPEI